MRMNSKNNNNKRSEKKYNKMMLNDREKIVLLFTTFGAYIDGYNLEILYFKYLMPKIWLKIRNGYPTPDFIRIWFFL